MTEAGSGVKALADVARLEDALDREAVGEVCKSFFQLFGVSVRVLSETGQLLTDFHQQQNVCSYVNTLNLGRMECAATVATVKQLHPEEEAIHRCFTGAVYRIVPIDYQGRRMGRIIIGPYLPAEVTEVPRSLLQVDPGLDAQVAREQLGEMPRIRADTAARIAAHLRNVLDILIFSGHRVHLTSEMHISSVRESYRELAEKTEKLQAAYDRLRELDRLKSNFLATISHELRTPLTSIIGYAEMLGYGIGGDLNQEQKEFVETIREKGTQLLKLITSLLDLSRLEQDHLPLNLETVDPTDILQDVATTMTPIAQKKKLNVHVETDEVLGMLRADPVRLRQALSNLADNAVKFTPHGGTVTLEGRNTQMHDPDGAADGFGLVLMSSPEPAVEFVVRDTGPGIPPEQQSRIFDAFYQVDGGSTREHGGAGLGLSIVKRLIEAHGGSVRVESDKDEGTRFFLTVPVQGPASPSM